VTRARKLLRWIVPFAITGTAVTYLVSTIDTRGVLERMDGRAAAVLIPALLVFGAVTLVLEALSLVRLIPPRNGIGIGFVRAARIKAASYPLALLHYALGTGGLAVLLSRRSGSGLADAAGIVMLIALFDMGMQLLLIVVGVSLLGSEAMTVRAGILFAVMAAILGGFAALRAPISLGPLERIRKLSIFTAARTTPAPLLLQLGALRLLFAVCFISMAKAALYAFDLPVPLGYLIVTLPLLVVVSLIPAVAGLGPGQVAFIEIFSRWGDDETLLACSLALSGGLIVMRGCLGLAFAREFTREAMQGAREVEM
jgi:hypothetical protein